MSLCIRAKGWRRSFGLAPPLDSLASGSGAFRGGRTLARGRPAREGSERAGTDSGRLGENRFHGSGGYNGTAAAEGNAGIDGESRGGDGTVRGGWAWPPSRSEDWWGRNWSAGGGIEPRPDRVGVETPWLFPHRGGLRGHVWRGTRKPKKADSRPGFVADAELTCHWPTCCDCVAAWRRTSHAADGLSAAADTGVAGPSSSRVEEEEAGGRRCRWSRPPEHRCSAFPGVGRLRRRHHSGRRGRG